LNLAESSKRGIIIFRKTSFSFSFFFFFVLNYQPASKISSQNIKKGAQTQKKNFNVFMKILTGLTF